MLKKNFLAQQILGGTKNLRWHCPNAPPRCYGTRPKTQLYGVETIFKYLLNKR